jgi:hypothetical protein
MGEPTTATPYRGRVDLGAVIVQAEIDNISSPTWRGHIRERPVPGLAPGPVVARLLDGEPVGSRANATAFVADDYTAVLHGEEQFASSIGQPFKARRR